MHLNGTLELGENIADVAGLAAHRAHGFSEVRRLVTLRKDV